MQLGNGKLWRKTSSKVVKNNISRNNKGKLSEHVNCLHVIEINPSTQKMEVATRRW